MQVISTELAEAKDVGTGSFASIGGRILAVDLGAKTVGVALSDELQIAVNPLPAIERRSWKDLLHRVSTLIESSNAKALVIGLPLKLEGGEGSAAKEVRTIAEKFRRSLAVPVFLQDERLTTFAAVSGLKAKGRTEREIKRQVDSEAAAIILRDFITSNADPTGANHS